MADAGRLPNDPGALSWTEAFQRLPTEAPPASAFPALAARLDARAARQARRHRLWWGGGLALAASLALLAIAPMLRAPVASDAPAVASAGASTGAPKVAAAVAPAPRVDTPVVTAPAEDAPTPAPAHVATATPRPAANARRRAPVRATEAVRADVASDRVASDAGAVIDLDALYASSRALETVLVAARDPRVASGPAAALASEYDATIATIDARLATPGLTREETAALWQARVATLREATGFETSQRVLAARGDSYGGALVRVD